MRALIHARVGISPNCLLARMNRKLKSQAGSAYRVVKQEKLAHPTRFERVTFAFGGHAARHRKGVQYARHSEISAGLQAERAVSVLTTNEIMGITRQLASR